MNTDDLIRALGADDRLDPPRLWMRITGGVALSAALLFVFWQMRPDFAAAVVQPLVMAKFALPLLLAGLAVGVLSERMRAQMLWLPLLAAVALFVLSLPETGLRAAIWGESPLACLVSVPALSVPIGIGAFIALRRTVVTDAARVGLVTGLLAGGLGALVYALHCDQDAPAFYVIWYSFGIVLAGLVGRAMGPRWLGV